MKHLVLLLAFALAAPACSASSHEVVVGAVYPRSGGQGELGNDEYRGVQLAVEWANAHGGVRGDDIRIDFAQADSSDMAPRAVQRLHSDGVPVILGTHGSTMSAPAIEAARAAGVVYWETGAVGQVSMEAARSDRVFRFVPAGARLGRAAIDFARRVLLPREHRDPRALRFGVVYVDDEYGRAVGLGAVDEIKQAKLPFSGAFRYDLASANFGDLARRVRAARTDVLFVTAYLEDGVAMRREFVRQRVPLVASIGTSSSYCHLEFGRRLGRDALGLFASDKPDGDVLNSKLLRPEARAQLEWARAQFGKRFGHEMPAGALTGFAGTLALVRGVLPNARAMTPDAIAAAARAARIENGGLPNGSGLQFGAAGTAEATVNLRATSVIWEWVKPGVREVVWPPEFATHAVVPMRIA
jgi:branched-chain amino acid transport system substrate-binding protein